MKLIMFFVLSCILMFGCSSMDIKKTRAPTSSAASIVNLSTLNFVSMIIFNQMPGGSSTSLGTSAQVRTDSSGLSCVKSGNIQKEEMFRGYESGYYNCTMPIYTTGPYAGKFYIFGNAAKYFREGLIDILKQKGFTSDLENNTGVPLVFESHLTFGPTTIIPYGNNTRRFPSGIAVYFNKSLSKEDSRKMKVGDEHIFCSYSESERGELLNKYLQLRSETHCSIKSLDAG